MSQVVWLGTAQGQRGCDQGLLPSHLKICCGTLHRFPENPILGSDRFLPFVLSLSTWKRPPRAWEMGLPETAGTSLYTHQPHPPLPRPPWQEPLSTNGTPWGTLLQHHPLPCSRSCKTGNNRTRIYANLSNRALHGGPILKLRAEGSITSPSQLEDTGSPP